MVWYAIFPILINHLIRHYTSTKLQHRIIKPTITNLPLKPNSHHGKAETAT